jgi:hypothetical protein
LTVNQARPKTDRPRDEGVLPACFYLFSAVRQGLFCGCSGDMSLLSKPRRNPHFSE